MPERNRWYDSEPGPEDPSYERRAEIERMCNEILAQFPEYEDEIESMLGNRLLDDIELYGMVNMLHESLCAPDDEAGRITEEIPVISPASRAFHPDGEISAWDGGHPTVFDVLSDPGQFWVVSQLEQLGAEFRKDNGLDG